MLDLGLCFYCDGDDCDGDCEEAEAYRDRLERERDYEVACDTGD